MALIEIKADLSRVADALERIALAVERYLAIQVHPGARKVVSKIVEAGLCPVQGYGKEQTELYRRLSQISDEELWAQEQERERRKALGYEATPGPPVEQTAPELGNVPSYTEMFEDAETIRQTPHGKTNLHVEYSAETGQQREP